MIEGPRAIYDRAKSIFFRSIFDEIGKADAAAEYHFALLNLQRHDAIVPMDEIDKAIRDINTGGQIKKNKIVETLFLRQPTEDGKTKYTRADIWNKVFENLGLDIKMPQGSIEHGNWEIENSPFKVTKKLSPSNTETVGVAAALAKDGAYDLNQPSKEAIEVKKRQGLFSHPFFTMPHPLSN